MTVKMTVVLSKSHPLLSKYHLYFYFNYHYCHFENLLPMNLHIQILEFKPIFHSLCILRYPKIYSISTPPILFLSNLIFVPICPRKIDKHIHLCNLPSCQHRYYETSFHICTLWKSYYCLLQSWQICTLQGTSLPLLSDSPVTPGINYVPRTIGNMAHNFAGLSLSQAAILPESANNILTLAFSI